MATADLNGARWQVDKTKAAFLYLENFSGIIFPKTSTEFVYTTRRP